MISVSEQECTHESGVRVLISETVPRKSTDRREKEPTILSDSCL